MGDAYNYPTFPPEDDAEAFERFPEHLRVGSEAPDPSLVDLETGRRVRLAEITARGLTVVEFGSLT
jgi:hypothetical protein